MNASISRLTILLILLLSACAQMPNSEKASNQDELSDYIKVFEKELSVQKKEIVDLKAQLQSLKVVPLVGNKLVKEKKPKRITTKKIRSIIQEDSILNDLKEETVVDSSQEVIHDYYQGLELLEDKQYDEALISFRKFLTLNPKHVYADRAQYLIAETHFKSKEYGLVVVATNLLESNYPYSIRLPDALYQRGLAYLGLNQEASALSTLKLLTEKYPDERVSNSASVKIAELTQKIKESKLPNEIQ